MQKIQKDISDNDHAFNTTMNRLNAVLEICQATHNKNKNNFNVAYAEEQLSKVKALRK